MIDLSLYLVADPSYSDMLQIVEQAVQGGVSVVQLRAKKLTQHDYMALAKKLKVLLDQQQIPLIINDHVEIAKATDAAGVHIGQQDCTVSQARAILGKDKLIGLTVNSLKQMELAQQMDVDYLGVGPIFATQSKQNPAPVWGLDTAQAFCQMNKLPAVAIGGINETNAQSVYRLGFSGIAVLSAICSAPDPRQAAQALRNCIEVN